MRKLDLKAQSWTPWASAPTPRFALYTAFADQGAAGGESIFSSNTTPKKMKTIDAETGAIVLVTPQEVAPATAQTLEAGFHEHFANAESLRRRALAVTVKDADDREGMKEAREVRLQLRAVRVAAEKTRKSMKEESLRTGKAIDGLYNLLAYAVEPLEKDLTEKEEFALRERERQRQELRDARSVQLAGLSYSTPVDLADLTEEQFAGILQDAKDLNDLRIARERKAEEERIAAAKAAEEERERVRIENERLKAEAAAREAEMKAERERVAKERAEAEAKAAAERRAIEEAARKEREAAEAKAKAEAAARAKAEAEARALREANERREAEAKAAAEKAERERIAAEKKAARAPDRAKFGGFASQVRMLVVPDATTEEGQRVADDIKAKVESFAKWIEQQAATL